MLDQGSTSPPPPDGRERAGNGASSPTGAATAAPPRDETPRPTFDVLTERVAGAVTDSTSEVLHQFARELHEALSAIRSRLDEASARLGSGVEAYRDAPGQIAEALAALGEALGEIAGSQAAVDERLAALSRESSELRSAVSGDLVERVGDAVSAPLTALREDVAALRTRLETGRKSRPTSQLAADLSAVEDRLEEVEAAVGGDLVDAVFERMEQAFDRRFDALVQLIDTRLRDLPAAAPPEPARRGILRRA